METNKHSVLNASNDAEGFRTIDLTASKVRADGLAGSDEKYTLKISDNPYYYANTIRFNTDGPVTLSLPFPRFMRHLIDIYGYDAVKSAVDNFPQELRYKTKFGGDR